MTGGNFLIFLCKGLCTLEADSFEYEGEYLLCSCSSSVSFSSLCRSCMDRWSSISL